MKFHIRAQRYQLTMNKTADIPKFILWAAIGLIIVLLLNRWVAFSEEFDAQNQPAVEERFVESFNDSVDSGLPAAVQQNTSTDDENADLPIADVADNNEAATKPTHQVDSPTASNRFIYVTTDTIKVTIDKLGGDIIEVSMLKHLSTLDEDAQPLRLLEKNNIRTYIAQSGLIGKNGPDSNGLKPFFSADQQEYTLDADSLDVVLRYRDADGVEINKIYRFVNNDYLIDINYQIINHSDKPWQATFYSRINRDSSEDPGADNLSFGARSYLGAATSTDDDPYKKLDFEDIREKNFEQQHQGGWVAMIQHYFVSAWIPEQSGNYKYFTRHNNGINSIGFTGPSVNLQASEEALIGAKLYAGPKDQYRFQALAESLDLTVDFGFLWWIAQPLYALLLFFATGKLNMFGDVYDIGFGFGNWGMAIIMLTVVIKALFFKLSATSYRSMANMRRVQPKMMQIKERYGNDKQAQSKAMMELYQKEKINPLGGCLPILIQMPVFIALYWALMESVELRHAPFILWIKDMSVMDPYFVLPIIMGATMWFQQRLNPTPPDPIQAKVMQWMPILFTFFFLWFPAGLVIYWISNNLLSILQQWYITRQIEKENA